MEFTKTDVGLGFSIWDRSWILLAAAGGLTVLVPLVYVGFLLCMRRPDPTKQDTESGPNGSGGLMTRRPSSGEGESSRGLMTPEGSRETSESRHSPPVNGHFSPMAITMVLPQDRLIPHETIVTIRLPPIHDDHMRARGRGSPVMT